MPLLALLAAAALWFSVDARRLLRERKQWPLLAAALLAILLIAKGKLVLGVPLVIAVALLGRRVPPRPRAAIGGIEGDLALGEASNLLGVAPDADRETILAAHRRLIARNHPDNGGTQGLAARLNAARDILLQRAPH